MKKIISIILLAAFLFSGCSFIGKKENSDSDTIIPKNVQTEADKSTSENTSVKDVAVNGNNNSTNTASASDNISSTAETSNGVISSISSDAETNESIIENGAGKGVSSNQDNKNSILITLYYKTKEGLLVPVTRNVIKQEGLAKAAINGLVDEAITREQLAYYGLYPVLPQGTKIKGMDIKNGNAVIDFSKEFMNTASAQDEQIAVASVVYTLTGFKTISNVSISVDGKPKEKLNYGTDISEKKNRNSTLINSEEKKIKEGYIKCDLFYPINNSNNTSYYIPVSKQFVKEENDQILVKVFNELNKTPSQSKYFTTIPKDTKLLSCVWQNDLAILDFSSSISSYDGKEKENVLINQIYYTIGQFKGISKAKILINGKEAVLPEGTEVSISKRLPITFNSLMDK